MSSPKEIAFPIYDASTRAPVTGVTPTFLTYKDNTGTNLSQPAISEIGGGFYKFAVTFADPAKYIVAVVDCGSSNDPRYLALQIRPEDFAIDLIQDLHDVEFGRWQVHTSGPDINRLVLYRPDGTVLKKFDLQDQAGAPTTINPFKREPV